MRAQPDVVRRGVPLLAVAVAVVAVIADRAGWIEVAVLGGVVAGFVLWERRPGRSTVALTVGVLVALAFVQLSGRLEPTMFLMSLLAVVVAAWEQSPWRAGVACLAAAACGLLVLDSHTIDPGETSPLRLIGVAPYSAEDGTIARWRTLGRRRTGIDWCDREW